MIPNAKKAVLPVIIQELVLMEYVKLAFCSQEDYAKNVILLVKPVPLI